MFSFLCRLSSAVSPVGGASFFILMRSQFSFSSPALYKSLLSDSLFIILIWLWVLEEDELSAFFHLDFSPIKYGHI